MTKDVYHIGIDEAGYGPNLGPFVMTVVACRAPRGCLWQRLKSAVRRDTDDDDGRTLVADSKAIHMPAKGVGPLEQSVAPWLRTSACVDEFPFALSRLIEKVASAHVAELQAEAWFHGQTALPANADMDLAGQ